MTGTIFLNYATLAALGLLTTALLLAVLRIILGNTLPDRILGLDVLTTIAVGYTGVFAVRTGFMLYIDIAIAISLVGFLATVALARYVHSRGRAARNAEQQGEQGR
ncbi:MAG TPA: cation:proton antiporter [Devosiaceae bacterium]|jgi:multicomponent Na+:H+ antiporter subunit F